MPSNDPDLPLGERTTTSHRIGIAGVGRMGLALASRFSAAGYQPCLYNRTAAKAIEAAERLGCPHALSASSLAASCDIVFVTANDGSSEGIYDGPRGLLASSGPHLILVEASTLSPDAMKGLSARVTAADARFAEISFTGRPAELEAGKSFIMTSGEAATLALLQPYLQLCGTVRHAGPIGSSAVMKLVINAIAFSFIAAVGEGLAVAELSGISRGATYDLLLGSPIRTPILDARKPAFLNPGTAPVQGAISMVSKILEQARTQARAVGAPSPSMDATLAIFNAARAGGFADRDVTAIVDFFVGQRGNDQASGRELPCT